MHYLFFDCETTGLDSSVHNLLTVYFGIYDEQLKLMDELDLKVKPDDLDKLVITEKAMEVTGINIDKHLADTSTITNSEAEKVILDFLEKHKIKGKRKHFRPCGQNVAFDIDFVTKQLVPKEKWDKLVHYRPIDTLQILTFLQDCNILPKDLGNLGSQVEYFDIPMGQAHDAREDILMTVEVYKSYRKLIESAKDNMASASSNNLLSIVER
ncbi:MAG: 3'-5' exonuclease [Candidatus Paceibacterota bacterium]